MEAIDTILYEEGTQVPLNPHTTSSQVSHKDTTVEKALDELALPNLKEVSWEMLKTLRLNAMLTPGGYYCITDYVTRVNSEYARSAEHPFDVIVFACSKTELSEDAVARKSQGDSYFGSSRVRGWKLKYCLDNDQTRFDWADPENGRGVIWWMKDEWGNQAFYDFKNIQYRRYLVTSGGFANKYVGVTDSTGSVLSPRAASVDPLNFLWVYTFSGDPENENYDGSLRDRWSIQDRADLESSGIGFAPAVARGNRLGWVEASPYLGKSRGRLYLNNAVLIGGNSIDRNPDGTVFGTSNTHPQGVTSGDNCYNWTCGYNCYNWTCGDNCYNWTCGNSCYNWTCGNSCYNWTCGDVCYNWTCGDVCYNWTCGNSCTGWTGGDSCTGWTCGNSCSRWMCGGGCYGWTCGNSCSDWSCGEGCYGWTCGNNCIGWSCGNNCYSWVCRNTCNNWTCGSKCYKWTCGSNCTGWSCGNNCYSWVVGNFVSYWSAGVGAKNWACGKLSGTVVSPLHYYENFRVEQGVENVVFSTSVSVSRALPLKNFTLGRGLAKIGTSKYSIEIDPGFTPSSQYTWIIDRNISGDIIQYCPADR